MSPEKKITKLTIITIVHCAYSIVLFNEILTVYAEVNGKFDSFSTLCTKIKKEKPIDFPAAVADFPYQCLHIVNCDFDKCDI